MKKIIILFLLITLFSFTILSCKKNNNIKDDSIKDNDVVGDDKIIDDDPIIEPVIKECDHVESDWIYPDDYFCEKDNIIKKVCTICNVTLKEMTVRGSHNLVEEVIDATCTKDGKKTIKCNNCNYIEETILPKTGHNKTEFMVTVEPTLDAPGKKQIVCLNCGEVFKEERIFLNGYLGHGKLSVNGRDLVDASNNKFQLYGLSYHGLQWFGKYVNHDTIFALQQNFGINVIRLACYSSEGGYAEGGDAMKAKYKKYIDTAIKTAYEIGLYVVVDWHMLGADNENDKNPLYYMDDAIEFFSYVSKTYKDYDNVLYEIMNEPCGSTTWQDCKDYANTIIPIIRDNTDAVILVGNPRWTSDLTSVINDPLTGYDNIMYTYHFYAGDTSSTNQVVNAYNKGIPVFISEFGFMDADGNGSMNYKSGENWLKVLNDRNISYIAWNISNSKGSSSIIKQGNTTMTEFVDANLKEWGIYLRNYYRKKSGLDE